MLIRRISSSLAVLSLLSSSTIHAVDDVSQRGVCNNNELTKRDAIVLETLGAFDYIDLLVHLQTLNGFSQGVEKNDLNKEGVSGRRVSNTTRVSCPGGGNLLTKRLANSHSNQETSTTLQNCVLYENTYNGSFLIKHVPTKYSEIVDINVTSNSDDGTAVRFQNANFRYEFSDHYLYADFNGLKKYTFEEMSKKTPDDDIFQVNDFSASVFWEDRSKNTSQLQTKFDVTYSSNVNGVGVSTEKPLIVDGNYGGVRSGSVTLNELNSSSRSAGQIEARGELLESTNGDRTVNECLFTTTLLRFNTL